MSSSKYRLKFPKFEPEECRGANMQRALEEIKFSKNCLIMYQADTGEVEYMFTGFDEELMATLVVLMSIRPKLQQYLKLALVITDQLKKSNSKGVQLYNEARKFVRENLSQEVPTTKGNP